MKSSIHIIKTYIILAWLVLCPALLSAQVNKAELKTDTTHLRLGQQTMLSFTLTCKNDLKPVLPDWTALLKGKLDIIKNQGTDTIAAEQEGFIKVKQELIVAKFTEDTLILDSLIIPLIKKRDTTFVMANTLKVYPVLENVDMEKGIRDIKSPEDIPFSWKEVLPYVVLIVGVMLLLLLVWIIFRIIKRLGKHKEAKIVEAPPPPPVPAHIIAMEKLEEIRVSEKWNTTASKEYCTEITDILREYIYNRWEFDAMESTSEEILAAPFISTLSAEELKHLKEILKTADFVKFAKAQTAVEENKRMFEHSTEFVNNTKSAGAGNE